MPASYQTAFLLTETLMIPKEEEQKHYFMLLEVWPLKCFSDTFLMKKITKNPLNSDFPTISTTWSNKLQKNCLKYTILQIVFSSFQTTLKNSLKIVCQEELDRLNSALITLFLRLPRNHQRKNRFKTEK